MRCINILIAFLLKWSLPFIGIVIWIILLDKVIINSIYWIYFAIGVYVVITIWITYYRIRSHTELLQKLIYWKCSAWITWLKAIIIPVIFIYFSAQSRVDGVFRTFEILHKIPTTNEVLFVILILIAIKSWASFDKYALQKTDDQIQAISNICPIVGKKCKKKLRLSKKEQQ